MTFFLGDSAVLNFQTQAPIIIRNIIPRAFIMNTYVLNIASSLALTLASSPLGESAVDTAKRLQLGGFRNHDFNLLLVMTALVAFGVIMEGPEIVHEARNAWLQCRGRRARHRSIAPWITLIGAIGWLFIAVGVAGEVYWEVKVSHDDEAITSFDEQKLGDAEKSAADANKLAGELGVKVDELPSFVAKREGELNDNIAQFRRYARFAQGQTANDLKRLKDDTDALNNARDDATAAAKQAERERAAMEAANAPRYLTPQQQADFVAKMATFPGLSANVLTTPSNTPDVGPLAALLESLLVQAKWKTGSMQGLAGWAKYVHVCVGKSPKPAVVSSASIFAAELNADGIPAFVDNTIEPNIQATGVGTLLPNPDLLVIVGSKQ
jgi:hypothetical protein